jgi:hypothetical protein
MNAIIATTTWNCVELIETFLLHHRRLGFQQILVMDFDSVDGTRDVLMSNEWKSFVGVVPFPGIADLDSSNLLLAAAKRSLAGDSWCLFCDPDELLVTPSMSIGADLALSENGAQSVVLPRFNVTAERSVAQFNQERLTPLDALTLRVDRREHRTIEPHSLTDALEPPWIFTAIPGKAFVSIDAATWIGDGDHTAQTPLGAERPPDNIYLLHYPFRSFRSFSAKIELAEKDFGANANLSPTYGWQLRRWIKLARRGRLFEEYLCQFVPDENVDQLLRNGTLSREWRIATCHQR